MKILQDKNPVLLTDTFDQWRIKFNDVLSDLQDETFASTDGLVTTESAQVIEGIKTFSPIQYFIGGFNTQGSSVLGGETLTINTNSDFNVLTSSNGGAVRFVGSGINFLTDVTSHQFTLGYESLSDPQNISLKYSQSGANATFTIDNDVTFGLENSKLKVGNVIWNLPTTSPTSPSLLRWVSNNSIVWQTVSDFTSELISDPTFTDTISTELLSDTDFTDSIGSAIISGGITLASEVIPVGTTVDIDATAVTGWTNGGTPNVNFPGWLFLDGSTISKVTNTEFTEIVNLLNPGQNTAVLTDSRGGANVKIIKYKKDPVSTFKIVKGDGVILNVSGQNTNEVGLLSGLVNLSLSVNSSDFTFNSGTLTLNSNVVKRVVSGNIQSTVDPTVDNDLTRKSYVDNQVANVASSVAALTTTGSTITLGEAIDGFGYNDSYYSMSLINKDGNAVAYSNDYGLWDHTFYANSVVKSGLAKFKKSISSVQHQFFIDEDDIIYGRGYNDKGQIAQINRGNSADFPDYYRESTSDLAPYNKAVLTHLFPALLPQKSIWDANAVTVDYITGPTAEFGSRVGNTDITVKTKDGVEPIFNTPTNPRSGLVKLNNNNIPYTRGYVLSNGSNIYGQFGRGDVDENNSSFGSLVWGPRINNHLNFLGRSLWLTYGVTEQEYSVTSSTLSSRIALGTTYRNQLEKRFNFYKPNAIKAGGLGNTDNNALSTWRTNTGLTTQSYSDYNWFIKKIFRTWDAHYVIVGKPGSESENEIWAAGRNVSGSMGNNHVGDIYQSDFMPMLSAGINFDSGTYTTGGNTTNSTVFTKAGNSPHNFSDFDNITIGTVNYIIITGDMSNNNRSTQFRLINKATTGWFNIAVNRLLDGLSTGVVSLTKAVIETGGVYRGRLKGVYDLHAASSVGDTVIMKKVLTQTSNLTAIDSLPESAIITNQVLSCGGNSNGEAAVGSTNNVVIPTITLYNTVGLSGQSFSEPTKVNSILTINDRNNQDNTSVILDSNGRVWTCGSTNSGLSGFTSALNGRWTQIPLNTTTTFNKIFVTNLNPDRSFTAAGIVDSEEYPRLFLIGGDSLFAAGSNHFGALGTSEFINTWTSQFVKIKFPENVNNISEIRGFGHGTLILCKNSGENIGRVYYSGQTRMGIFSTFNATLSNTEFKIVDKFLV
jgi:alpha-tubulin suppressor-like RCC1 family protein